MHISRKNVKLHSCTAAADISPRQMLIGCEAAFLVNYLPEEQTVTLLRKMSGARLHSAPLDRKGTALKTNTITLMPLSAVMITY